MYEKNSFIREIQTKIKLRNFFFNNWTAKLQDNILCDEAERNRPFSYIAMGNVKCTILWRRAWQFLKTIHAYLLIDRAILTLRNLCQRQTRKSKKKMYAESCPLKTTLNSKKWKQPNSPSVGL